MRFIKYLCAVSILFASCRVNRNSIKLPDDVDRATIVATIQPPANALSPDMKSAFTLEEVSAVLETQQPENIEDIAPTKVSGTGAKKKITSFSQMKAMAATGEIAMSKKDLKTLNRLEKHYKGNFEQFRADTFEFTNAAKVVGGIGLLGLLLGIITGSAFGWFLFIVAALAFLLRYLNIIAF